ncbi:Arginine--tRNA cytoplasmic [Chlorella sorokiniana]|uniref:Arginine--tRNA cytoplasmic n=1 Tax=Chlorella sorokiniana TaxID=3076 RepID=A0A2P6TRD9_CHLSO|nr:Arginine--tRNA cytoplasmic [Chlorella sorokiniana]|eukprot:PRW56636.1 Arginine--tRNA cytoplasmic [Chlorella sorokiniana]
MDAASGLLLLGVLILLCKEPASEVRIGHPLATMVAAMLVLPVLALLPGALRSWYVRHRERLLLLFFLVALTYQQASVNFVNSHFARSANARYINGGFQWITVDGLLLQMRFCHQLPTLLTCFLFNLGVIPQFCRLYHSHLEPRYCAAVAAWRGLLCLLAPLLIIYLLELRVRRGWLLQRQERERQEEQQREQLRVEQLERRRRGRG